MTVVNQFGFGTRLVFTRTHTWVAGRVCDRIRDRVPFRVRVQVWDQNVDRVQDQIHGIDPLRWLQNPVVEEINR